jgi:hypothetical protein
MEVERQGSHTEARWWGEVGDLLLVAADAEQASGVTLRSPCAAAQDHGYLDHMIGYIFVQSDVKRSQNGVFHILHIIRGMTP